MSRLGFVRDKLDIKILILYFLARMRRPALDEHLDELAYVDGAINYFDFRECLDFLVETGHVVKKPDGYVITEVGRRNAGLCESSLAITARNSAAKLAKEITERIISGERIRASISRAPGGEYTVSLAFSDGDSQLMRLELLSPSKKQAELLEKGLVKNAQRIYDGILNNALEVKRNEI